MRPNASLAEDLAGPGPDPMPSLNILAMLLITIPLITIGGNVLVILSVLRFRALQSAINFLILGLAVADLLVAIFVMPYAVYVHVYRGMWYLGHLMCDIYMASDVACSTASILLLAVISFDRFRAVSRPIQYSRQSQNVRRVFAMIVVIWFISLTLASPIVFGVNDRPADANENECRFYNAEFSIGSSIISFVIPCFLVLFVYIRIIVALKKREKAARLRRQKNAGAGIGSNGLNSSEDCDEAGRIVAAPDERNCGVSTSPRSSVDESLSENANVVSNDFISEAYTSQSRRSSVGDESQPNSSHNSSEDAQNVSKNKKFKHLARNYSSKHRRSLNVNPERTSRSASFSSRRDGEKMLPSIIRTISRRSPRIFRKALSSTEPEAMVLANPTVEPTSDRAVCTSQTESETISASRTDVAPLATFSRSTTINSDMLGSPEESSMTIFENQTTEEMQMPSIDSPIKEEYQPTVTFAMTVRNMAGSPSEARRLKGSIDVEAFPSTSVRKPSDLAVKILTDVSTEKTELNMVVSEVVSPTDSNHRRGSAKSTESHPSLKKTRNGLAMKLVKKTMKHEQSLKRKVSKAQRKEKRATKTLGVVVGVFLICWVPFFAINIVNAICILADKDFCQVGFDLFFYCTWLGYMNSFMNPIIYTIFNTEFRRAFKSILFGRNATRGYMLNKQVHL